MARPGDRTDGGGRIAQGLLAYGLIVRMWVRSALAYRASFLMMAFGNFAANALDFVAIMLMFSRIDALGGFSLPEVAFLYGTSGVSLGLADLLLGSIEGLGRRVRDGTLDVLLLRPPRSSRRSRRTVSRCAGWAGSPRRCWCSAGRCPGSRWTGRWAGC